MGAAGARRHVLCAGSATLDVVQFHRERPAWGTKATSESSYADVGGPAANAAVTVALLGGRARLATAIGQGALAEVVWSLLESFGVEALDFGATGTELPVSSVWVERATGSRTVLSKSQGTVRGDVALPLDADTAAVLVDGYYPALCERVVERAAELGCPVVLDGGSWKPVLERILPRVSVAILSADFTMPEAEGACGFELARALRDRFGVAEVAITRGPESVLSLSPAREEEIAVPRVKAVDTLGAGDVFHGAYLYFRYLAGRDNADALREAARVASASCEHMGAREGVRRSAQAPA